MLFKKEFLVWLTSISAILATLYFYTNTPNSPFLPSDGPSSRFAPIFDPTSQSNLNETRVIHNHLSLTVNFTNQTLDGSNTLTLVSLAHALKVVKLDIRGLKVNGVRSQHGKNLKFRINSVPGISATLGK
jgi:aminopeptidase N